jgi:ribosome-binding factor A
MSRSRRDRIAQALRDEVSALLRRKIRDPRIGFVTITDTSVSPDLTHAKIYVTVLGEEKVRKTSLEALNRAAGFLQRQVFKQLGLKKTMQLAFLLDETVQSGNRIEELLHQIQKAGVDEEE